MQKKSVTLALQGGGSHGAFTWGVLDRLLDEERIEIEGISGASAGAINAAILAHGFTTGGRAGSRVALAKFWTSLAEKAPVDAFHGGWLPDSAGSGDPGPFTLALLFLARFVSPYQFNPLNLNPLRDMMVVLLNPSRRAGIPATAQDFTHRLTEISFNSSFCAELQGIALAKKEADRALISFGRLERRLGRLNLHLIDSHDFVGRSTLLSRLNTTAGFITALCDEGKRCADQWLAANFGSIGARSTVPVEAHLFE